MDHFTNPQAAAGDRRMYGIRFSPNEKRVVVARLYGTVSVWDGTIPSDLRLSHEFSANSGFTFGAFDYSPDGVWIATGSGAGRVEISFARTGDPMLEVGSHEDRIYTVRFGGAGHQLVSGGAGISYLWVLSPQKLPEETSSEELWTIIQSDNYSSVYAAMYELARRFRQSNS